MKNLLLLLLISLCPTANADWLEEPTTYDECILATMKGVTSDEAAFSIQRACRNKFANTEQTTESVIVPSEVLKKIKATAHYDNSLGGKYYFGANVYNGNEEWHITEAILVIKDNDTHEVRRYKGTINMKSEIAPLTTEELFVFMTFKPQNWSWALDNVKGYKK